MNVGDKIRGAGLKVTQQRIIVYRSMRTLEHSSVESVVEMVHEKHPDISIATIYRIMESFCDVGLLLKFMGPSGKMYFDITPEEHLHFFTSKDTIIDVKDSGLLEIIQNHLSSQLPTGECLDQIYICITTKEKVK